MMKTLLFAISLFLSPSLAARTSDSYCSQLDAQGVEGKSVTITAGVGNEIRTMDGVVLAIEPGTIILRPGKVSDEPQPLYDHGRIVEPDRTRVYVNCAQVFSVVVNK